MPAIDVTRGRLGRFAPAGPLPVDAFGGDPLAAAASFVRAGASWLHVVDMDLAFDGEQGNLDIVTSICAAFPGVRVQASGGVRTAAHLHAFVAAGAARVVLGSSALTDEDAVAALLAAGGPEVVVGLEVLDGRLRSRGRDPVDLDLMATLGWLTAAGTAMYLVTAVDRVGVPGGPDIELIRQVVRSGRPTLAAGGIGSLDDLRAVRTAGAVGAVVGRGAIERSLDLAEAFAWAAT